jgi:pimeloyl-ACP methyl ester carboxylesterase
MTAERARAAIHDMASSAGFVPTMRATADLRYLATATVEAPVTVAFGSKDLVLLRRQSRHLDQLPAHTTVAALPGCGHVPMTDDPVGVAALIRTAAFTAAQALAVT